jgi:hypothetical protein
VLWMYKINPAAYFESTNYLMDVSCTSFMLMPKVRITQDR